MQDENTRQDSAPQEPLKACPFCGSSKVDTFFVRDGRRAACGCGASLVRYHGPRGDTDAEVRRAWNARTPAL